MRCSGILEGKRSEKSVRVVGFKRWASSVVLDLCDDEEWRAVCGWLVLK